MKRIPALFVLLLLTSGCSLYTINSEEVTENYYPPKKSTEDTIYLEEITQAHEIIGFVTVNTERRQKMQDVLEKMKREASLLGGDAITNITRKTPGGEEKMKMSKFMKFFENGNIRASFTATVVALGEPAVRMEDRPMQKDDAQ